MESTGLWNIVGRRVKLLLSIKTQSDLFSIFLFLFFLTQFWYCIDVMMSTRLELAAKAGSMLDRKSVCSNYNYSNYRCPCKIFTIEKWDTFVSRFYFTTVLFFLSLTHTKQTSYPHDQEEGKLFFSCKILSATLCHSNTFQTLFLTSCISTPTSFFFFSQGLNLSQTTSWWR